MKKMKKKPKPLKRNFKERLVKSNPAAGTIKKEAVESY